MARKVGRSHQKGVSRQTRSLPKAKANTIRAKLVTGLGGALLLVLIIAAYANHFQNRVSRSLLV
jgi:hypothetical protein